MRSPGALRNKFRSSRALALAGLVVLMALQPPALSATGPDLKVTKQCVSNGPHSVMCTVTVTNIGNMPSSSPVTLVDTPVAARGGSATYRSGGQLASGCTPSLLDPLGPTECIGQAPILPGQTVTARFGFELPAGGLFTNCVTVTQARQPGSRLDPVPANNTDICTTFDGGGEPHACPVGSASTRFPGSRIEYCCTGTPGRDDFCCTRAQPNVLPGDGRER